MRETHPGGVEWRLGIRGGLRRGLFYGDSQEPGSGLACVVYADVGGGTRDRPNWRKDGG
jgi:hypothetical protein